jgi:hypothetical protein
MHFPVSRPDGFQHDGFHEPSSRGESRQARAKVSTIALEKHYFDAEVAALFVGRDLPR